MDRPYPVAGLFATTCVLWLASIGCAAYAAATFDFSAAGPSLSTLLAATAALAWGLFALWTGWRACRALDFLVSTAR